MFSHCEPTTEGNPEYNDRKDSISYYGSFDEKNDVYSVFQDEDITVVEYALICYKKRLPECIEDIYFYKNEEWQLVEVSKFPNGYDGYRILINFEDRIQKIKLTFKNNLADDYVFEIKYVEADKQAYYEKLQKKKKDKILANANIKFSVGADLVNIYFQPCCEEYKRTEIVLYKDGMMLAKYKVDEETFFKSIDGLAYGKYEFILKQFDSKEDIILETEKISFSLLGPRNSRGGCVRPA